MIARFCNPILRYMYTPGLMLFDLDAVLSCFLWLTDIIIRSYPCMCNLYQRNLDDLFMFLGRKIPT